MAIPTSWFVRTTGAETNSGGSDANGATLTIAALVVVGTTGTSVAGGFNAIGSDALGINIQDGGASLIRGYAVVNDTTLTLSAAPTGGDNTYAAKIGGARTSINDVVNSGAGNNAIIANTHRVGIKGGTYTENTITPSATLFLYSSDEVEWVVDGTGGGAGSDGWAGGQTVSMRDGAFINCVDEGILSTTGTPTLYNMRMQANGGDGLALGNSSAAIYFCSFIGNTGIGLNGAGTGAITCEDSRFDGNTSHNAALSSGLQIFSDNIVVDSGADGVRIPATGGTYTILTNCTIDGNTGDGLELTATNSLGTGSRIINNLFTNNANGVNSSAGAQTNMYLADYNTYFGNTTARVNFNTGTNDTLTDPIYTTAASDDYTVSSLGSAFQTGFSKYGGNNKVNRGAVGGSGSAQVIGGHPSASDVRVGVSYANGTLTGTMSPGGGLISPMGFGF